MVSAPIPTTPVHWKPCWRIIPSRYPPINLFERIADPADWDALIELESLTNDRIRDEIGEISLVPSEDRVSGTGASYIMAPFTHITRAGSRFSDGTYGVFYAGHEYQTAIEETIFHRICFLQATNEPPTNLEMIALKVEIFATLHDIRSGFPELHHPDDYIHSRSFAAPLRNQQSYGIVYNSVRNSGGECAAIFRPTAVIKCSPNKHLIYRWDGKTIIAFERIR